MAARTVLALDTSTMALSLAVVRVRAPGQVDVLAARDVAPGPSHSALLPGLIDEALQEAGVSLRDLDAVAVGLGPGGFTGLRVALSTAKGLCYAARLPLVGASTLEAMALVAARRAPGAAAIVPLMDARKREVYAGFYRPLGEGVVPLAEPPDVVAPPAAIAERLAGLPSPQLLLGEGYFAYRAQLDAASTGRRLEGALHLPETPPAVGIAELSAARIEPYDPARVFALEPNYIRRSEAELGTTASKKRL